MEVNKLQVKSIEDVDLHFSFFHYTSLENIPSIEESGLLPRIGDNAIGIEKTRKIFFTIGERGIFSIFDSWIRWLIAKRLIDLPGEKMDIPIYRFCTLVMRLPVIRYLTAGIVNGIVHMEFKCKSVKIKAFKIMKEILENSCFLVLDLKDGVDFSYEDIDEVKARKFNRKLLKTVYAKQHKMDSKKMDYWNMHTFSDVVVPIEKISLLHYNNIYNCLDILLWLVENTNVDMKAIAPFLCEFLEYYHYF